jgi:hypothetical protein
LSLRWPLPSIPKPSARLSWEYTVRQLKNARCVKFVVFEQVVRLLLGLDPEGFDLALLGAKSFWDIVVVPWLNIIIHLVHTMDEALDRVAFVANDESIQRQLMVFLRTEGLHDWLQSVTDYCTDLLSGKLERAITHEKDSSGI